MRVLPSVLEDAVWIGRNLRPADALEIRAGRGWPAYVDSMVEGFYISDMPMTFHVNGAPAGMFGAVPTEVDGECRIWLMGTPAIEEGAIYFLRHCKKWLKKVTEDYKVIYNYAHKDNELHLKWLRWMGFDIGEAHPDSDFLFVSYSPEDN